MRAAPSGRHAVQVIARHAKARQERHWHAGGSMFVGALAAGLLAAFIGHVPFLAFAAFAVALMGIWGVHGPLLSWPAVFLQGPAAASGAAGSLPGSARL